MKSENSISLVNTNMKKDEPIPVRGIKQLF